MLDVTGIDTVRDNGVMQFMFDIIFLETFNPDKNQSEQAIATSHFYHCM